MTIRCTYCHGGLERDEAAFCASCLAPHHSDCHTEHGHCAGPGCLEQRTVRPEDAPDTAGQRTRPSEYAGRQRYLALFIGALLTLVGVGFGWTLADSEPRPSGSARPEATAESGPLALPSQPKAVRVGAKVKVVIRNQLSLEANGFSFPVCLATGERLTLRREAGGYTRVLLVPAEDAPSWRRPRAVMVVEPGHEVQLVGDHFDESVTPRVGEEITLESWPDGGLKMVRYYTP